MRSLNKNISFLLATILMATISSCSDSSEELKSEIPNAVCLTLNIRPLSRDDAPELEDEETPDEYNIEKIKSVRLVILDNNGRIEKTAYFEYEEPRLPDRQNDGWIETLDFNLTGGKKKIYLIANESSIIQPLSERPGDLPDDDSLKDRLNRFIPGNSGFEQFITSLYFNPDYSKLLPYSSFYELNLSQTAETYDLYLVPVATKFQINFYNYRSEEVVFSEVTIQKIADYNYLIPHLSDDELNKNDLYWVDWLKQVSDETSNNPDLNDNENSNDLINSNWGWITGYSLPDAAIHSEYKLIEESETWTVPYVKNETIGAADPGVLNTDPIYLPESRCIENQNSQKYAIKFVIKPSVTSPEEKIFVKEIEGLASWFRNTYLYIDVDMESGAEDIYIEIKAWRKKEPVYGTISPEDL